MSLDSYPSQGSVSYTPSTQPNNAPSNVVHQLSLQAGGHAGTIDSSTDGRWVYKATSQNEVNFYERLDALSVNGDASSGLAAIKPFVPHYQGSVNRRSLITRMTTEDSDRAQQSSTADRHTKSIILSNLCYGLSNPTVGDFKIGTRLYGPTADLEKRKRQDESAATRTVRSHGLLLAGAHTFLPATRSYVRTTKKYGGSLNAETLSDIGACIFPRVIDQSLPSDDRGEDPPSCTGASSYSTDNAEVLAEAESMLSAARTARLQISEIAAAVKSTGWDFPGSSLLIVYGENESGEREVRCRLIDFAHAHEHERGVELGLPNDGVDAGLENLQEIVERRETELEETVTTLQYLFGMGKSVGEESVRGESVREESARRDVASSIPARCRTLRSIYKTLRGSRSGAGGKLKDDKCVRAGARAVQRSVRRWARTAGTIQ